MPPHENIGPAKSPVCCGVPIASLLVLGFLLCSTARGQFSPGDLSRAHENLEGSNNCTKCHEVGREISGTKCLACHQEIAAQMTERHGFHFAKSNSPCVDCHKDHLGRDAKTVKFSAEVFNHDESGFPLVGKHAQIACQQCHSEKHIANTTIRKLLADFPHESYVGLKRECISCHADVHEGKFKSDCSSCHDTRSWKTVTRFDHALTKYPLEGKHRTVQCIGCHPSFADDGNIGKARLSTKSYADCTPCHTTSHRPSFSSKECRSCHSTSGWETAMKEPFDHRLTLYTLKGAHATLRCDQCHKTRPSKKFTEVFTIAFRQCTDCHRDKHNGEFTQKYNNDCSSCHNESSYRPSTFAIASHQETRFVLTGAHTATLCSSCHRDKSDSLLPFHQKSLRCETCHEDTHRGQFKTMMAEKSCGACHSTSRWDIVDYDHSKTSFPLIGKHAQVACSSCHKRQPDRSAIIVFEKVSAECESCHEDAHRGQFVEAAKNQCSACHNSENWTSLLFDHQKQSSFSLKGGHEKLRCGACHKEESIEGKTFIRFRPLSGRCESCHAKD